MSVMRKLRRNKGRVQYEVEPLRGQEASFGRKMSEVILDFAEPLLKNFDDDEDFESVIAFATICWNLSFLPEQQRQAQLNAMVDKLSKSDALLRIEMEDCAKMLLERKRAFFANNRRMVVDYEVVEEKDEHRLLVMSTLAKS